MKKWLIKIPMTLFAAMFLLTISAYFIFPILNDIKAEKLAKEMLNTTPPNNTEIVEAISGCGNTGGTGNHTEVWIGLLVKSGLSKKELLKYYSDLYNYIEVYETAADGAGYPIIMQFIDDEFKSFENISNHDDYFIIGRTENAVSSSFDLRGH
ncbi:hypothetical protein DesLBE_0220 [Desulfitobacterium sp. LBE]|uniref:hypothetical protein n=1 Tax=Desulfitobacterium sp. LBE TaxID=884086 RepID=UPI00119C2D95|nr:hypothetical protein [Desulfitobacterium sp. LBE]TWH56033.1 hypothetical protein DesLBE_0220 [Desulfitobacterium sp. LBE]